MRTRSCGHDAPAVCQDESCSDWRQAYVLDICCSCQRARRERRAADWQTELELRARAAERRRQLRFLRLARATMAEIRRELARR